ncbi:Molybdate transporter 1 [Cytospora mali]|uniref:Molybdate transporter 1 n=1 Tax=Cytospora mali TaxID=578113 RepID=A0A194VBJ6_CYTMA|nr:Molybdate transporter 1 [Valsa mali var. pyri (nom. inval.)]
MALKDIPYLQRHNVRILRSQPLAEISGALGDLGTLLPLMIALALQGSVSLPSTLVFSGLFNIATGVLFGIPLPVQPMKAIAAAAIASHASQKDTIAAGALVASAVLILSATGLLRLLTIYIPIPVVKGIQFGAGLSLVISAGTGMLSSLGWVHTPFDNRLWALAAFLLLIFTARTPRRFPYALIVFTTGLVLSIVAITTDTSTDVGIGFGNRRGHLPGWEVWRPFTVVPAWGSGPAWSMAIAQLPLTTLNSVIAAAALAADLMGPELPGRTPGVTELGLSVAAMNLLGCWFGAMPVCHGAGGLAAQYRFGARSGSSIIILGAVKLLLGLFLGTTLLDLLGAFPKSILGIMVIAAGLELAKVGQSLNHGASDLWEESVVSAAGSGAPVSGFMGGGVVRTHRDVSDEERQERWNVMLVTTAGILAFKNDAVGFVADLDYQVFCPLNS